MSSTEHGAAINRGNRPLSPHLQVYKLPLTAKMSILHRMTGVANAAGSILVVWWFIAAAIGASYFDFVNGLLTSVLGQIVLIGFGFSVCYHLCNGVRHLIWDAGYGFEVEKAESAGRVVLVAAVVFAVALFFAAQG